MSCNKEAIIICLDVGPSMRTEEKGAPPFFDAAIECVKWILKRRIFAESSDEVALLLFGSDASNNPFVELGKAEYQNVSLASELKTVDWDLFESVCSLPSTKCGPDVDFCRALTVAATYLVQATQAKRFAQRSLVLLSCFSVHITVLDRDLLETLIDGKLELAVIGPDHSDSGSRNVPIVQSLVDSVSGIYCPFKSYHLKQGWKFANARCPYMDVTMERTYHSINVDDDDSSEQKPVNKWLGEEISERDLVKAFRYGASIVPLSKLDEAATKYQSEKKGIQVLGFINRAKVTCPRDIVDLIQAIQVKVWHFTGNGSHMLFADPSNRYGCQILSALIRACHSTEKLPLVRYVYSASSIPRLCVLIPVIKTNYECMEKRAMHPEEPLLPMDDRFLIAVSPLDEIMKCSGPCLNLLKEQFHVEHLGRKKSKRAAAKVFKAEENVTTLQQIAQEHKGGGPAKVGTVDPVNDFQEMIKLGRNFVEASEQFVEVILHLMFEAHDIFFLRKAVHCAAMLRKSCVQESAPNVYNRFLGRIKQEALENSEKIVWVSSLLADDLGPISSAESSSSKLSCQEAADFFKEVDATKAPVKSEQLSAISTNLINELE
ncbi:X-ray repair cross-complementing protein 5 [Trichuris trichiura]|uniref:X-ray repair cross-complementing protein 5 n=1 Tax=Trichuris trichiura TaxID=36087 RepID=A0A077Z3N7_TRITR|nr:X-ray repair cross-complementing protein 5 [Trichuris trichiura]